VDNLLYPQIARLDMPSYWGVHTAKPIYGMDVSDYADNLENSVRDFLIVVSEASAYRCQDTRDVMFMVDITEVEKPAPVSTFQVPEEPGDFCNRGGRFGPHGLQDASHPGFDKTIVLLSYFNAGIRAVDIRDPFRPREIAYFVPEVTTKTVESCIEIDGVDVCDVVTQTNNVNIDDRGYIYSLDRAHRRADGPCKGDRGPDAVRRPAFFASPRHRVRNGSSGHLAGETTGASCFTALTEPIARYRGSPRDRGACDRRARGGGGVKLALGSGSAANTDPENRCCWRRMHAPCEGCTSGTSRFPDRHF
jgi:hypothetical protein